MSFPPISSLELPLLEEILAAGEWMKPADAARAIQRRFPELTSEDLALRDSRGQNLVWDNRVHWARLSLVQKGELFRGPRGRWRITAVGKKRLERTARTARPQS